MRMVSLLPKSTYGFPQARVKSFSKHPPLGYFVGLILAAISILLVPLAYMACLFAIGALLFLHLKNNWNWFFADEAHLALSVLYFVMAVPLVLIVFFGLSPFFQKTHESKSDLILTPEAEPRLYAFIMQICLALGSSMPKKIYVNMDINASARFATGWQGFAKGHLELMLGLPLVKGLELDQFVGVLSHELGHFRQGIAMLLVQAVRAQNQWFSKAAERESGWELNLKRKSHRFAGMLFLPGWMALLCKSCVRQVHISFIKVGTLASCHLLRQMEFEADRAAVRMIGGESFANMVLEAKVLEAAWGLANRSLGLALREGRLADDLPALVAAHTRVFIPEVRRKMERNLTQEKTAWFDTHPSLGDRISRARQGLVRGVFHAKGNAHALFTDFPGLAKQATLAFYHHDLGEEFNPSRLIPTSELVTGQSQIQVGESAVHGYFLGLLNSLRPISISVLDFHSPQSDSVLHFADLRKKLFAARKKIEEQSNHAALIYQKYSHYDSQMLDALQAMALMRANFWVEPGDFQLHSGGISQASATFNLAEGKKSSLSQELEGFETEMRSRLIAALSLLEDPDVFSHLSDARACYQEVHCLLPGLAAFTQAQIQLDSLRRAWSALGILLENESGHEKMEEIKVQIKSQVLTIRIELEALRTLWVQTKYPFGSNGVGKDLATYAFEAMPLESDSHSHYTLAEEVLGRCYAFYFRIMGRLALNAGRVEGVLGFGPILVNEMHGFESQFESQLFSRR